MDGSICDPCTPCWHHHRLMKSSLEGPTGQQTFTVQLQVKSTSRPVLIYEDAHVACKRGSVQSAQKPTDADYKSRKFILQLEVKELIITTCKISKLALALSSIKLWQHWCHSFHPVCNSCFSQSVLVQHSPANNHHKSKVAVPKSHACLCGTPQKCRLCWKLR